jgi:methionyl-tRNA synthetase
VRVELPEAFDKLAFAAGIEAWMQAVFACNAYVDEQAPWALRKTDPARMERVLATLCGCIVTSRWRFLPLRQGFGERSSTRCAFRQRRAISPPWSRDRAVRGDSPRPRSQARAWPRRRSDAGR